MKERFSSFSQRENYAVTKWNKFLWWLATAEKELLQDCVIDRNRYAIIGTTVLGTWLFATIAWGYFFYIATHTILASILLGIFMGGMILIIDRALIKGISKWNKNKFLPLAFRGILAIAIGTFMAQPALLYLFDKEIHVQISLDNEQKKKEKLVQITTVYATEKKELTDKKTILQQQIDERYKTMIAARNNFIAEADGTGGTKKIGLKDIALAKQKEYEHSAIEYQNIVTTTLPQLKTIDSTLNAIAIATNQEQILFATLLNDGFLTRIEALNNLLKTNTALQFRYYLLVFILLMIELMPVLSKTILPAGTYEEKVLLREKLEKTLVQQNIQHEQEVKELYNQLSTQQNKHSLQQFFAEITKQKNEKILQELNQPDITTIDESWNNIKRSMLLKEEI